MSRITRRMAQDELAALEGRSRLSFHPNYVCGTQSKNISDELETQYIEPAVLDETALSMQLRAAQLNNDSAMEMEERAILLKNCK